VAPNAGTFTVLNNQVMADAQPGADPCAKINTAIGLLNATQGGTVDARGFTASQLVSGDLFGDDRD
jgi:hypothetical protein